MKSFSSFTITGRASLFLALILNLLSVDLLSAQSTLVTATVSVTDDGTGVTISPAFMGLSYEMSLVLPNDGKYYFDANDRALVNTFRTLGIKNLRVGANAVDNAKVAVPQEKDIDSLFDFARAAGVKVIYSFRLKKGDPAVSARLAAYISAHDADALDCFSIGNEPNVPDQKTIPPPTFETYFATWKPHYDAIIQAVPSAMFDGPSVSPGDKQHYPEKLADAMVPGGHMAMISSHYYVMGPGRAVEQNPPLARAHFLSNDTETRFEKGFEAIGSKLMAKGIPYRIDEVNNCFNGGAKGVSDTYTAALWALDASHWWAARHILGLNYHTGEMVDPDGSITAQNYSAFLHQAGGHGLEIRPPSYGYLAFAQGALGRPLQVAVKTVSGLGFTAYAYRADDGSVYVTLINKTYATNAKPISVSLQLPGGLRASGAQRMDLMQKNDDITAQTDITLGGAAIDAQGIWTGHWQAVETGSAPNVTLQVAPASAAIINFLSPK